MVAQLQGYYGINDVGFAAFLGTLGLRISAIAGADKLAWQRLNDEINARLV